MLRIPHEDNAGQGSTLMSFQSRKLHSFKALLSTMGVTSLITCVEEHTCLSFTSPHQFARMCRTALL